MCYDVMYVYYNYMCALFVCIVPGDLVTKLTLATSINLVARAMAATNSGLERKDHKWLKMKIPNSFLGVCVCVCCVCV